MEQAAKARIVWLDGNRKAQNPPDPAFPNGVDAGPVGTKLKNCKVELPYPAPQCGAYLVKCETCQQTTLVTTAGRPDDPRSVTMICRGTVRR